MLQKLLCWHGCCCCCCCCAEGRVSAIALLYATVLPCLVMIGGSERRCG